MNSAHLVLVPGLLCTDELFTPQIAALRNYVEISVADTRSDTTIDAMADRILAAAPDRFALCGLSMGGYVALALMRKAPERVSRLVLMDTSARTDTAKQTEQRRRLMALGEAQGMKAVSDALAERILGTRSRQDAAIREVLDTMADDVGVEGLIIQQEAIIGRMDSRGMLGSISTPTLVIVGEEDAVTPRELAEEMVSALPDARLIQIEGFGHMTTLEAPDATNRALSDFLRDGR